MTAKRIPVGIAKLDPLIRGGVIKNSINLVACGAGTGKTIFALQFLINGITKYDEPGIYITFEEKKKKKKKHMQICLNLDGTWRNMKSRESLLTWIILQSKSKRYWLREEE